ncbi:MAG: cytochrome c oxidase subunit 3 [Pseudomonadales bacterium]|nr:cytochrome c oxidase subunit 3 [Pseudomonadales bacterium]
MTDSAYEPYYVPHSSKLPIFASIGIFLTVFGIGHILNDLSAGVDSAFGMVTLILGGLVMGLTLFFWFSKVIEENYKQLYSNQMNRSYVWGMSWFIFSEVMFFAAFFGALFYVRVFVVDWIGGVGDRGPSGMLWPNYEPHWPLLNTPDPERFPGASGVIPAMGLPLVNTLLLVTSSFTVSFAHHAIKEGNRKRIIQWLTVTVTLGLIFLFVQGYEYVHAYNDLGLTLGSGIYGTTFFMLTGFHGAHVTLGTFMLLIMLFRALKGHFTDDNCFGFEAAAWYWHFVDVVWIALFIFVYVLGG